MAEEIAKTLVMRSFETGEMTTYRIYDEDVQNRTAGIEGLTQEEGDSASLVMSQRAVAEAIENQEGQTSPGSNGVTFTPSVSAAGVISWTNDGGLTNPASVNIKGPKGDTGTLAAKFDATAFVRVMGYGSPDGFIITKNQEIK